MTNPPTSRYLDDAVTDAVTLIESLWKPIDRLPEIASAIRDAAVHAARAWFVDTDVTTLAFRMTQARCRVIAPLIAEAKGPASLAQDADATASLLYGIGRDASVLGRVALDIDGPWDMEREARKLVDKLLEEFPSLNACELQLGAQLPHQLQPHVEHFPRNLALGLVSGLLERFMLRVRVDNTDSVMDEIRGALPGMDYPEVSFERTSWTAHPILAVLCAVARPQWSQEQYADVIVSHQAFLLLSDDEKRDAARQAAEPVAARLSLALSPVQPSQHVAAVLERLEKQKTAMLLELRQCFAR